jgi:hypothetical protein
MLQKALVIAGKAEGNASHGAKVMTVVLFFLFVHNGLRTLCNK